MFEFLLACIGIPLEEGAIKACDRIPIRLFVSTLVAVAVGYFAYTLLPSDSPRVYFGLGIGAYAFVMGMYLGHHVGKRFDR